MEDNAHNLPISLEVLEEEYINDVRYTKVKIWLMHLGFNQRKKINFTKEVIDEAIPTLKNIPIVSEIKYSIMKRGKDFANHEIYTDAYGNAKKKTKVVGVIPESNNAKYEERLCDDYMTRTFLTVEGLIWNTRSEEEVSILKRDGGIKGQSMELHPDLTTYTVDEEGILVPTALAFDGACILGDYVTPAFENSTLELFSDSNQNLTFSTEVQERLSEYYDNNIEKGGGDNTMNKDICKSCGTQLEAGVACTCGETELVTKEEFEASKKADNNTKNKEPKAEPKAEPKSKVEEPVVEPVVEPTIESTVTEPTEPTVVTEPTTTEPTIVEPVIEPVTTEPKTTSKAKMPSDFSLEDFEAMQLELEQLKAFKQEIENKEKEVQQNTLFSKYQALSGLEEYNTLKEQANNFSIEDLDKEFALLLANNLEKLNFSASNKGEELDENDDNTNFNFTDHYKANEDSRYGSIIEKYGSKK